MQYGIAIRTVPARRPRDRRGRASVSFGGRLAPALTGCPATPELPA
jgi:hypothetical protein